MPTITHEMLPDLEKAGIPVVSSARKFILAIPADLAPTTEKVFLEPLEAGETPLDYTKKPVTEHGLYFKNYAGDSCWQVVKTDGTGVIIFNQVDDQKAGALHDYIIQELADKPMTVAFLKNLLAYTRQTLQIHDRYNSDRGFILSKMSAAGGSCKDDAPYGLYKRNDRDICFAVYLSGEGEYQGPAATPQQFKDGAVIIKHGQDVRLIQPDIFEQTYKHPDGGAICIAALPCMDESVYSQKHRLQPYC